MAGTCSLWSSQINCLLSTWNLWFSLCSILQTNLYCLWAPKRPVTSTTRLIVILWRAAWEGKVTYVCGIRRIQDKTFVMGRVSHLYVRECHKVSHWLMQKEAIFVRFFLKKKDIFSWTIHMFLVAHSHDRNSRTLKCAAVLAKKKTNSDFKIGAFYSIKHIIFCKELQKSWYLIHIILEKPHLYIF